MIDWFASGGVFMWPVLVAGVIAVALAVRAGRALLGPATPETPEARLRSRIDAVLFWGGFAAIVGLLGTLGGVGQLARAMSRAGGEVPTEVIWGGLQVTLPTIVLGLAVLLLSLALWFGLRVALRKSARG